MLTSLNSSDGVVIVGAGIIGLNAALVLAKKGYGQSITVVAEYFPGDTSSSYTSPWWANPQTRYCLKAVLLTRIRAGCNFSAISGTDANALRWDRLGYEHLSELADKSPQEAYVHWTPSTELWDQQVPRDKIQHMSEYLKDFRVLDESELPEGVQFAASFTTLTVNAPQHIKYLQQRLQNEYGVRFVRHKLLSIEAAYGPSTKVVFNCTGLASATLLGVADPKCYPTSGQVVLVRGPHIHTNMMRHGLHYETYVIPRPGSNGNAILGGYMQKGVSDGSTYALETQSILARARDLSPEVRLQEPEVLAVFSGLRPSREGGARVEREEVMVNGQSRVLVHNYGAGGTGFQAGYGMALESVAAVEDVLGGIGDKSLHPRL
ncbi:FAD dependent oxidoreductase [Diaporthe amygdali]|uniref:FAD dependent oxidoreductase n=1 Tax=Phomopsis amygdali TaxID=1214568 RepID=UPI0022FE7BBB|nr:FAD dependent oxidoreductase [Diaporthe amygdali]KAJ0103974.1 FAD dependent oxidoreductase [Diaporthe amygdali]